MVKVSSELLVILEAEFSFDNFPLEDKISFCAKISFLQREEKLFADVVRGLCPLSSTSIFLFCSYHPQFLFFLSIFAQVLSVFPAWWLPLPWQTANEHLIQLWCLWYVFMPKEKTDSDTFELWANDSVFAFSVKPLWLVWGLFLGQWSNAPINCMPQGTPPPPRGDLTRVGVKYILNPHPGTNEMVKQPHPVHTEITVQTGVGQCAPPP